MTIKKFVFSPFSENTYIVYDQTAECIIIDPGCFDQYEQMQLGEYISDNKLKPVHVLNTHCHLDHVFGNNFLARTYGLKSEIHRNDLELLRKTSSYAQSFGLQMEQPEDAGKFLSESDTILFGNSELKLFHIPGHSPGHLAFYNTTEKIVFCGDILFKGSIGRTDLPGGNFETLISGIKTKLFSLPDDTVVYSGHGENTSIGAEKRTNPFVKE